MSYDPLIHRRRSVRLKGYDYAQAGAYFVTICAFRKRCVFGRVQHDVMNFNRFGLMARDCWLEIPQHYPMVELDEWQVMPNHVHGILVITDDVNANQPAKFGESKRGSLATIINRYKGAVTRQISEARQNKTKVWQDGFHDRIIRDERELENIRRYIIENPLHWPDDEHYTE
jgi:REP element-mobilizing transposase RayT